MKDHCSRKSDRDCVVEKRSDLLFREGNGVPELLKFTDHSPGALLLALLPTNFKERIF